MFKLGDKVKCIKSYYGNKLIKVGITGKIVHLADTSSSIGVEWKKDIGGHTCNKNCKDKYGYYVSKENIQLISSGEPNKRRTKKMNKKKIKIEIQRTDGKTYLLFEIDPSMEKIFKKQTKEVRESGSWHGLKFYYIPNLTQSQDYKDLLFQYHLIDDFGTPLYADNNFNIAFIRTVGGKGKILIKNDIPFAVVSNGMRNIVSFMKRYYEDYMKDYAVKGFISFEV